jgi:hypothetical protein
VYTGAPIPVFRAVTLAAQLIGGRKIHQLSAGQMELVPVRRVVAIQAPAVAFIVAELDILVKLEFPPLAIGFHVAVAFRAGENPITERRGWDAHFFRILARGGPIRFSRPEVGCGHDRKYQDYPDWIWMSSAQSQFQQAPKTIPNNSHITNYKQ